MSIDERKKLNQDKLVELVSVLYQSISKIAQSIDVDLSVVDVIAALGVANGVINVVREDGEGFVQNLEPGNYFLIRVDLETEPVLGGMYAFPLLEVTKHADS